jgi:predicted nucleic acid-binding protein
MTGLCFVDSNIFVYRHDISEPEKRKRAQDVLELLWRTRRGRVSEQVLNELYVVATRKLARGVPAEVMRAEIRQLQAWQPVALTQDLRESAWQVQDRIGLSFWDALIVAAAKVSNCDMLLSEDMQDGATIDDIRIVNPFARQIA